MALASEQHELVRLSARGGGRQTPQLLAECFLCLLIASPASEFEMSAPLLGGDIGFLEGFKPRAEIVSNHLDDRCSIQVAWELRIRDRLQSWLVLIAFGLFCCSSVPSHWKSSFSLGAMLFPGKVETGADGSNSD